jgi:hypothetical protein
MGMCFRRGPRRMRRGDEKEKWLNNSKRASDQMTATYSGIVFGVLRTQAKPRCTASA